MPKIDEISIPVLEYPNKFISPFADDAIPPLYSSIPIILEDGKCLPCAICANSNERSAIIQEQAKLFSGLAKENDSFVGVNAYEAMWLTALSSGTTISNFTITFGAGTLNIDWGDGTTSTATSAAPQSHTY